MLIIHTLAVAQGFIRNTVNGEAGKRYSFFCIICNWNITQMEAAPGALISVSSERTTLNCSIRATADAISCPSVSVIVSPPPINFISEISPDSTFARYSPPLDVFPPRCPAFAHPIDSRINSRLSVKQIILFTKSASLPFEIKTTFFRGLALIFFHITHWYNASPRCRFSV